MQYSLNKKLEKFMLRFYNKQKRETTLANIVQYLGQFKKPQNAYEMSYDKYLCRMSSYPKTVIIGANALSLFAVFIALLTTIYPSRKFPNKPEKTILLEKHYNVPFSDILPPQLTKEDERLILTDYFNKKFGAMSKEAKAIFFKGIKLYPFHFFFQYLLYKELVAHSFFILSYNPRKVAVYVNERNPVLPLLTDMYEENGRKLVSFMHGEYNLQLVQSFMKFSEYFIWDDSYIDMFDNTLRCEINKYTVYTPLKETKKWHLEDIEPGYDYTYYFSMEESEEAVIKIFDVLKKLNKGGYKCKARVHPRNTANLHIVEKYADNITIEYPKDVSLEESLGSTRYAIGLGTTVLIDAVTEGREVIIDDLSDPFRFENLKKLGNRSFEMEYHLLSEYVQL